MVVAVLLDWSNASTSRATWASVSLPSRYSWTMKSMTRSVKSGMLVMLHDRRGMALGSAPEFPEVNVELEEPDRVVEDLGHGPGVLGHDGRVLVPEDLDQDLGAVSQFSLQRYRQRHVSRHDVGVGRDAAGRDRIAAPVDFLRAPDLPDGADVQGHK